MRFWIVFNFDTETQFQHIFVLSFGRSRIIMHANILAKNTELRRHKTFACAHEKRQKMWNIQVNKHQ